MNVLEAITRLDELNFKVESLRRAIFLLDETGTEKRAAETLETMREEVEKECVDLKNLLEKTPLITMRSS